MHILVLKQITFIRSSNFALILRELRPQKSVHTPITRLPGVYRPSLRCLGYAKRPQVNSYEPSCLLKNCTIISINFLSRLRRSLLLHYKANEKSRHLQNKWHMKCRRVRRLLSITVEPSQPSSLCKLPSKTSHFVQRT